MSISPITRQSPLLFKPIESVTDKEQGNRSRTNSPNYASIWGTPANGVNGRQQQDLYRDPNGQLTSKKQAFDLFARQIGEDITARNNKVIKHEQAHQRAAKGLGGSPVYIEAKHPNDPLGRSYYESGFVNIAVPHKIDKTASLRQIEDTKKNAQITIEAAEAPASFDELSGADRSVAAKGRSVLSSAQVASQQRQELEARLAIANNGEKADNPQGKPKKPEVGQRINFLG